MAWEVLPGLALEAGDSTANAVLLADAKIVPDSASAQRGGWALPVASTINLTLPGEHPWLES